MQGVMKKSARCERMNLDKQNPREGLICRTHQSRHTSNRQFVRISKRHNVDTSKRQTIKPSNVETSNRQIVEMLRRQKVTITKRQLSIANMPKSLNMRTPKCHCLPEAGESSYYQHHPVRSATDASQSISRPSTLGS